MIINCKDRWLVITPPKTGSNSLNHLLRSFGATVLTVDGEDHHQSAIPERASGFRIYCLVRNPFARASSLWRWAIANHRAYVDTGPIFPFSRFVADALIGRSWPAFFHRTLSDYAPVSAIPFRLEPISHLMPNENRDPNGIQWIDAYQDAEAEALVVEWARRDFEQFGYPAML